MPGQAGARYAYSPKHITDILEKIRNTGRPDKLTAAYVRDTWLLKDNNVSSVLPILEDMAFTDSSGTPTERYDRYRNDAVAKETLGEGIRIAYAELFKAYPDANSKTRQFLEGYFKQKTGQTPSVVERIVSTFMTLCSVASFSAAGAQALPAGQLGSQHILQPAAQATMLPITMNIQIVIPSDASEEQYDKIFSSIKKFLTK